MTDLTDASERIASWLQPLDDESAPCGPDLEYDNEFLELTQAAAGKPESQFGPAEPPNWLAARNAAERMLDRSRDLRLAVFWLRSGLHLYGHAALPVGLRLINGLLDGLSGYLHPQPDPDDGDPYARVNALSVLVDPEGLIADLRTTAVIQDRAIGQVLGRALEVAALMSPAVEGEDLPGKDQIQRMLQACLENDDGLRARIEDAVAQVKTLQTLADDRIGESAPSLRLLLQWAQATQSLMPRDTVDSGDEEQEGSPDGEGSAPEGGRGFSGSIRSRQEALRAIDLVCEYLERTEPSNPAPLFLRRARQLVNHNFLQLMKELAPAALPDMARIVGVDPDTVQSPENS